MLSGWAGRWSRARASSRSAGTRPHQADHLIMRCEVPNPGFARATHVTREVCFTGGIAPDLGDLLPDRELGTNVTQARATRMLLADGTAVWLARQRLHRVCSWG